MDKTNNTRVQTLNQKRHPLAAEGRIHQTLPTPQSLGFHTLPESASQKRNGCGRLVPSNRELLRLLEKRYLTYPATARRRDVYIIVLHIKVRQVVIMPASWRNRTHSRRSGAAGIYVLFLSEATSSVRYTLKEKYLTTPFVGATTSALTFYIKLSKNTPYSNKGGLRGTSKLRATRGNHKCVTNY